ncbi:MAG: hypothetical protein Q9198_008492 [Flavoplaca austrocitrina]
MRPIIPLWTFPLELSAADRAFYTLLIDYEREFNLDRSQTTPIDLESEALHLNTSIEAAMEHINGKLACSLMRVLAKGKGQPTSTVRLVVDIALGSQELDIVLTKIFQLQKLIKEFDQIGRAYEATAMQTLLSVTGPKLGATNRQFGWLRSFFLPAAHKEWSSANERLDKTHQYQTALNLTGQSLTQRIEEIQTIRDQLRRFNERTQALPGGDTSQIEHWLTGHLQRRFAQEEKSYTPFQREVWLKDLEYWCDQCRSIDGNHDNGVAASPSMP